MNVSTSDPGGLLQFPASRWAKTGQEYPLLLSALQYSLRNSILIASEQDIKCLSDIDVEPFIHQVENLKQFVNNYPQRMMLLDDVGLGKTISAGLILTELLRRRRISNFLIVCPAILVDQWKQELKEKFRLRDIQAGNWQKLKLSGTADPETLRVITTYDAVRGHENFFLERKWDFVVADEGDYLKTLYSANGFDPSNRARTFYRLLKEGHADFFLLLTATPLRKNLWDVFNLAEITAQPSVNPIGTWQSFPKTFIADDPVKAREIRRDQQGEFRRRLTEISIRTSRSELHKQGKGKLVFPEREVRDFAIQSQPKRVLIDLTLDYLRQRYNFLRKIEVDEIRKLIAHWKREVEKYRLGSWEQLKTISEEVAKRLGEYEFTAVSPSGERYTTGLSYQMVSQALLAFVERVKPWVTALTDPEKVCQILSIDLDELVGRFFEEEIKRRRSNKLEEISLLQSLLSSPAAGAKAFRDKRARSLTKYERDWLDLLIQQAKAIREPEKAKQLLRLAQKLREERPHDYRLLVFTIRWETQNFLGEYLEANGFKDQVCYIRGGCPTENRRAMDDFSGVRTENGYGPPRKHILISTDTGSAGVNLQACNIMVNYDLSWVPMTIEQRIGRIQRLGQTAKYVIVNNFYIADTIDETIVRRLLERIRLFELAIGEVEAILKEAEGSADFDKTIFDLIMLSKERRDEELTQLLQRMNQDEAIRLLREEQKSNEELLGVLSSTKGMPRFTPRKPAPPRLDIRTFCQTAFEDLGHCTKYQPDEDLLYVEFKKPTQLFGNWTPYTFTEPDITEDGGATKAPGLLAEGTKDFEVLLRTILRQGGVFIRSCEPLEEISEESCLQALQQSLSHLIRPVGLRSRDVTHRTAWRPTWKVTTAVARDRFEKLMRAFLPSKDKHAIDFLSLTPGSQREALPFWEGRSSDLRPLDKATIATFLTAEVERDNDVRGFEEYYTQVKEEQIEGLKKWFNKSAREEGLDSAERQRFTQELDRRKDELEKQFIPSTEAAIVMVEGFAYRVFSGEVECTLERDGQPLRFVTAYEWIPLSRHGQVLLECRECHRDIEKQFEVCKAGHLVCEAHTARCGHPGCPLRVCQRCAPDFLNVCDVSEVYVCTDHLQTCPSCGKQVLTDLFFDVEEAEQQVCPDCFEVCEETETRHLVGELEQSDLSGKLVCNNLLHTCPVTGKRGLAQEMEPETGTGILHAPEALITCAVTGARVAPGKVAYSGISGKPCLPEYLQRCPISGILALPGELEECAETKQRVDPKLLATCAASGQRVLWQLLRPSPVSGQLFLPRFGVADESTGDLCLPDEIGVSAVSGKKVRRDRLVASERSGRLALPEETVRCAISKELVLSDEAVRCEETNQLLSPRLIETDPSSGRRVYKKLMATCQITGQRALKRLTEPSVVSGKLGLRHLMDRDEVDGKYALPGELETCSVTGKRVTLDKLVKSDLSDRKAQPEAMVKCPETRKQVCPDELLTCQATGIRAVPQCFGIDEVTGKRVLKRLLVTCAVTTKKTLQENTKECVLTGQVALTSECEQCAKTGQWVIRGELEPSGVSGKRVLPALLRTSAVSGIRALPEEMEQCQETNQFALPRELEVCQISGKRVLPTLLKTCPDTKRRFLPQYGQRCAKSDVLVHPDTLKVSAVSGLVVRTCLLARSAVSNRWALPEEMRTCGESGKHVLPSELARCELSGVEVLPEFLSQCAICSRQTITRRQVQCQGCSGRYCATCVRADICLTCRSLQEPPMHSLDSLDGKLREAVLRVFPAAGRAAMSQNAQWVLVYAKPKMMQLWKAPRLLVFQNVEAEYTLVKENHGFKIQ